MTCIVGLVDKESGKVFIGADSAGVDEYDLEIRKDKKIFRINDFLFGCSGSFRMIQLLRHSLEIPIQDEDEDLELYMVTKFINAVTKCFEAGGFLQVENNVLIGGDFLVGTQGRLFRIANDFQVAELSNLYDAIGCGRNYALGAMSVLNNEETYTSKQKLKTALKTAAKFSSGVAGPFYIQKI